MSNPLGIIGLQDFAHNAKKMADTGEYIQEKRICMVISLSINISKDRTRYLLFL